MELSTEQAKAMDNILAWIDNPEAKQVEALAGYAGTGKTTLLTHLAKTVQQPGGRKTNFMFLTFTGKAASVLGNKLAQMGVDMERNQVRTIHSYIYRLVDDSKKKLEWASQVFTMNADWVIVVDEASMINDPILNDLKKVSKKILLVGDPGQLPPVEGATPQELTHTRNLLSTVHRQALENPIIRLAHMSRFRDDIPMGIQSSGVARLPGRDPDAHGAINAFMKRMKNPCSQIMLCGTNFTRAALNQKVRMYAGHSGFPKVGEKLVCLKNDKTLHIMNGQLFYVTRSSPGPDGLFDLTLYAEGDDPSKVFHVLAYEKAFGKLNHRDTYQEFKGDKYTLERANPDQNIGIFDFGYALTVHKSQGSEWDGVVLYNERIKAWSDSDYSRWLYTGITRAKERLLIVN